MAAQKALSLHIPDVPTLLSAYMPFLDRGGIFVPTRTPYALGQASVAAVCQGLACISASKITQCVTALRRCLPGS